MSWQAFASTFVMLFFAEMGDKTQIVLMSQSAKFEKPWSVWAGAVLALVLVSGFDICLGHICALYLKPEIIRYIAGSIFIVMGALMVLKVI